MKRVCVLLLTSIFLLCGCSKGETLPDPITDRVKAKVTVVISASEEYHISVDKDTDGVARYSFSYPDEVKGLEYAYVGDECTISFNGLSISLANSPNGVVDRLHLILCCSTQVSYDKDSGSFLGSADNFSYRIFTLSDGNLSIIRITEPEYCYYFNYDP